MNEPEFVVLQEAATQFHAEFIAGALKNAGIEAHTDGGPPPDEFQIAQRILGQGVRIFVRPADVEEALKIVETLRGPEDEPGQ